MRPRHLGSPITTTGGPPATTTQYRRYLVAADFGILCANSNRLSFIYQPRNRLYSVGQLGGQTVASLRHCSGVIPPALGVIISKTTLIGRTRMKANMIASWARWLLYPFFGSQNVRKTRHAKISFPSYCAVTSFALKMDRLCLMHSPRPPCHD